MSRRPIKHGYHLWTEFVAKLSLELLRIWNNAREREDKFYYHILFTSGTDLSVITKRLKLFEIVQALIRAPSYINRRTDGYV